MSEAALTALGPEKAFSICAAFIKSGGDDGKGTGVSNALGQGQEERKVPYQASHSADTRNAHCLHWLASAGHSQTTCGWRVPR